MIELNPLESLALTFHHSPGVQALLVGSGISRSAGIPTGWEITLDLVRRLAAARGVEDQGDWSVWYKENYKSDPNYSDILDAVASTPAERRSIIHSYIESGDLENPRQPTRAHVAIARLVSVGAIRVILTTNFDRLLENALRDLGVEPTVIASNDALLGATPLVHARCTIIKLHGDYMDARIKNTSGELDGYSPEMDGLLDRVLDEYGLVVAGWSGDWDTALRSAILRTKNRRYPVYWAARGDVSVLSQDLIKHRGGRVISIADADSFFAQTLQKVEALKQLDTVHPTSVALTVAEGRRLCRDDRYIAEFSDLLAFEIQKFSNFVRGPSFCKRSNSETPFDDHVNLICKESEALRRLAMAAARWGTALAFNLALKMISTLTFADMDQSGVVAIISMRRLGASLCFYWCIAAALMREDLHRVAAIAKMVVRTKFEKSSTAALALPFDLLSSVNWKLLAGRERHYTPHSDFFLPLFLAEAKDIALSSTEAEAAWDEAEFLISAEGATQRMDEMKLGKASLLWFSFGRYAWLRDGVQFDERLKYLRDLKPDSAEFAAGLFGGSTELAQAAATVIGQEAAKMRIY